MRILVISQYWAPENGVPQRRWSWLTRTLVEAGHEVCVLSPPPHYLRDQSFSEWSKSRFARQKNVVEKGDAGETIIRSGYLPGGMSITKKVVNQASVALGSLKKVVEREGPVRSFSPDIVIGTVPALPTALVTFVAAKRVGAPYIIDLRDAWPELLEYSGQWNAAVGEASLRQKILSKGPLQLVLFITQRVLRMVYSRADAILVTSECLGERLREEKTHATDVTTIRNVFPPETKVARPARGDTEKTNLNVLYAGTLGRAQNLENALHAAKLAGNAGVEVNLRFVGAGAARNELQRTARDLGVNAEFLTRRGAGDLAEHYLWADTALVHLTDWEPLQRAVPSKTYELIDQQLHISGVVAGETARLITALMVGDVVPPEQPEALARLWCALVKDPSQLQIGETGIQWLSRERDKVAPKTLLDCVNRVKGSHL